jgi:hypothetical protein
MFKNNNKIINILSTAKCAMSDQVPPMENKSPMLILFNKSSHVLCPQLGGGSWRAWKVLEGTLTRVFGSGRGLQWVHGSPQIPYEIPSF